jgi:transposase-like protein
MAEKGDRRRSAAEWQDLIAQLPEDPQRQAEFCRRRGIHPATLRWWRSRLRRRRLAAPSPAGEAPRLVGGPAFTELQVVGKSTPGSRREGFALRWPDGLVLRIPVGFDDGELRRLLRLLEQAGC